MDQNQPAGHSPTMFPLIVARIEKRLVAQGLNAARASLAAGLSKDAIRDMRRGIRGEKPTIKGVRTETLRALAPVLGTSLNWLATGEGPEDATDDSETPTVALPSNLPIDVPVMGTAAGSLGEGAFQISSDPVDFVRRPPALAAARDVYAIFIEGESMAPEHRAGDLRFVHPHRAPAIGDTVILHIRTSAHKPQQFYIKHLLRRSGDFIVCGQLNPAATIQFKRETVVAIHKVLTMNDLFGV